MTRNHAGIYAALVAFFLWGIFPLYWKWLGHFPVIEIICQRTVWSAIVLWSILLWQGKSLATLRYLMQPRIVGRHLLAGLLLSGNWLIYVWATLNDRILEGALGYFLNPFFNMLFGYLIFRERHSGWQKISIAVAMAGVACQLGNVNTFPWIAVVLGLSFALYAVVRKSSPLSSLEGLAIETALLLPLAGGALLLNAVKKADASLLLADPMLMTTGLVTIMPLLLFGFAARKISLTTLGVLQFLGPTLQFLLGWKLYREPISLTQICSFSLIWFAIFLYIMASMKRKNDRENQT